MPQELSDGLTYLTSRSHEGLLSLFWFVIIFEVPRYFIGFIAVAVISFRPRRPTRAPIGVSRVTAVIAGHNEEHSIERCVHSLLEQSRPPDEIIVISDGSTDRMPDKLRQLQARGLIAEGHSTGVRAGKSAGVNLAVTRATGDIIINVDCDCTYDRHAIKHILEPFCDPQMGAVAGNILVRNTMSTLITAFQAIEYLICVSQGKQAANFIDQMTCVSGAFGAFRRKAYQAVGGLDAGGGEDLDVTIRLRKAGWKTIFAEQAICYTDVPETLGALTRQRFRWERDAVRLRYRKHRGLLNPFSRFFQPLELVHQIDFIIFNIGSTVIFPFYVVWLFVTFGDLAILILVAVQAVMLVLDGLNFLSAAIVTPRVNALRLVPYVVGYSLFNGLVMRFVRLGAYLQEWIFDASYRDAYVPLKVHRVRR